jgi:preprotein translocase SecE subunit
MKSTPTKPPGKPAGKAVAAASPRAARNANARVFVEGVIQEMKRVTWPSREEWVTATLLTIGLVVVIGVYTGVLDWVFRELFGLVSGDKGR